MTLLFAISYSWNFISASILSSHISISNLTWNVVCSAIQTESSRQTNTANTTCYSGIPHRDKSPQW